MDDETDEDVDDETAVDDPSGAPVPADGTEESKEEQKGKFRCSGCDYRSDTYWMGPCPGCHIRHDVVGKPREKSKPVKTFASFASAKPLVRVSTGILPFDEVLGGGLVKSTSIVLIGSPGAGKTTLLVQTAAHIGKTIKSLYASGEQAAEVVGSLAGELGLTCEGVDLLGGVSDVYVVTEHVKERKIGFFVADSAQKLSDPGNDADEGTTRQVEIVSKVITDLATSRKIIAVLVSHINSEGGMRGGKEMEHECDAVVRFDYAATDPNGRIMPYAQPWMFDPETGQIDEEAKNLRVIEMGKNRYRVPTGERRYVEMTSKGVQPLSFKWRKRSSGLHLSR